MRDSYFKAKRPCKECPFIKGCAKGWLGPDTADEVMQKVHSEQGYVCHMSIAGKATLPDGTVDIQEHGHQCIGALLHANQSCKSYRDPKLWSLQRQLDKLYGVEFKEKVLDLLEFRAYHGGTMTPAMRNALARRKRD
jgi:hypothetical protein